MLLPPLAHKLVMFALVNTCAACWASHFANSVFTLCNLLASSRSSRRVCTSHEHTPQVHTHDNVTHTHHNVTHVCTRLTDDCYVGSRLPNGTLLPDPILFPSGMRALADYVHSKGLLFGVCVHPHPFVNHGEQWLCTVCLPMWATTRPTLWPNPPSLAKKTTSVRV